MVDDLLGDALPRHHHHRCHPDGLTVAEATERASATWRGRSPWVHISSPAGGWQARDPRRHADYIAAADFPEEWLGRDLTIDVEAKQKELAVLRLKRWVTRLETLAARARQAETARALPTE